jgi:hypothetical protein
MKSTSSMLRISTSHPAQLSASSACHWQPVSLCQGVPLRVHWVLTGQHQQQQPLSCC